MSDRTPRLRSVESPSEWERVVRAATKLQELFPEAVLVGGTAASLHARHRFSRDDDHVVERLVDRYDEVLERLESLAGWKTKRRIRPLVILGSLDGVDTGLRNLRRAVPLETVDHQTPFGRLRLPTLPEMLRIKAFLILDRNATRDYIDTVALADHLTEVEGRAVMLHALTTLDAYYPQGEESAARQLAKQLAEPRPYDLDDADVLQYRFLVERYKSWQHVAERALELAAALEIARDLG